MVAFPNSTKNSLVLASKPSFSFEIKNPLGRIRSGFFIASNQSTLLLVDSLLRLLNLIKRGAL
jgi:hypothetical protein